MDKSLSTRIGWTGYAKLTLLTKLHEWLGWLSKVFALALLLALFSLAFIIFSEPAGADYCCSRYFGTVDDGIWTVYAPNPAGGEPCVWVTVISDCPIEAYVIDCVDICPDEGCLVCVVPGAMAVGAVAGEGCSLELFRRSPPSACHYLAEFQILSGVLLIECTCPAS